MIRLTLDREMERRGVTRYELAKRTGIHYQVIDNYYKNKVRRYDSDLLDRICTALGCTVGDILEQQ